MGKLSYDYVHDVLSHDYGYTDDEVDEIVQAKPNILDCVSADEVALLASDVIIND